MQVDTSRHLDADESQPDGLCYEYDLLVFREGEKSLVARSYSDRPSEAHFLRAELNSEPRLLTQSDIRGPLAAQAIAHLQSLGKTEINWLSGVGDGYESVPS